MESDYFAWASWETFNSSRKWLTLGKYCMWIGLQRGQHNICSGGQILKNKEMSS